MKGKIVKGIAGFYYVYTENGMKYQCKAKGIFRNRNVKPLVGDDVRISVLDEQEKEGNIDEIFPRNNVLIRPAVANVDQAVILFAAAQPEPNLNLLDRFLVMLDYQEIPVSIIFNKTDLSDQETCRRLERIYQKSTYPVYFISALNRENIQMVSTLIEGKTTVLAGPSGVGKSSLVNLLQPKANMETGALSLKVKRGKHTTRHSELFWIAKDTYMMDTPGFSSMNAVDIGENQLKSHFREFEKFQDGCKFLGCVHIGETVCGVKQAVQTEEISLSRYENYCLMYQEIKEKRKY